MRWGQEKAAVQGLSMGLGAGQNKILFRHPSTQNFPVTEVGHTGAEVRMQTLLYVNYVSVKLGWGMRTLPAALSWKVTS